MFVFSQDLGMKALTPKVTNLEVEPLRAVRS